MGSKLKWDSYTAIQNLIKPNKFETVGIKMLASLTVIRTK
mgnify:CR=1 FL=1